MEIDAKLLPNWLNRLLSYTKNKSMTQALKKAQKGDCKEAKEILNTPSLNSLITAQERWDLRNAIERAKEPK